jgi:ubiquinone/menaquinone biosynthesis C-methylase UbiE
MVETAPPRTMFADVDRLPPPMVEALLGALERMAAHPEIRRVREVALHALGAAPGDRLLDAGCGVGEAARQLAARVAPLGEVVALDRSAVTVEAAAQRHDGSPVRYVTGDVSALDFPDRTFDGTRCERVLQHLTDPDAAIAELVRVTRPGGRVCLVDTDWDSVAADGLPPDLVDAVREHLFSRVMVHHRDMGRTLRRRLRGAGLDGVTAVPVALCLTDLESAATIIPAVNRQVPPESGMIPEALRERWFAELDAADRRGDLLATLTIWVASGSVRPS